MRRLAALRSLRWRLTLSFTAALAGALLVFSLAVYVALRQTLEARFDALLREEAVRMAEHFREELEEGETPAEAALSAVGDRPASYRVVEVYTVDGALLFGSGAPAGRAAGDGVDFGAVPELGAGFLRARTGGARGFEVAAARVAAGGAAYAFVVGAPRAPLEDEMDSILELMAVLAPLLVGLAAAPGALLAQRALEPVTEMAAQVRRMSADSIDARLAVPASDDELGELAGTFNDLLDRLERAFARMRQFMADASHELRTPVAVIRTEADVALTPPRDPAEAAVALEVIRDESARLGRLVDSMFLLARADANDAGLLASERVPLRGLLESCARSAAALGLSRGVRVEVTGLPADGLAVRGDRLRLEQMLTNLLENATKYAEPGARVALGGRADGAGWAEITVSDTGPGIPEGQREAVFERFTRLDAARKRDSGGSGLGLPIARWVAQAHGGTLELAPSGSGSTFVVRLPLDRGEPGAP